MKWMASIGLVILLLIGVAYAEQLENEGFVYIEDANWVFISGYEGTGGDIAVPAIYNSKPVTAVYHEAFRGNDRITSVTLPEGLLTIGESAFLGCTNLKHVDFPTTLVNIEAGAFSGCKMLELPSFHEKLEYIGERAFADSLVFEIDKCLMLPSSLQEIGEAAFESSSIYEVILPEGLETIGKSAFSRTYIRTVEIPSTVTSLSASAFENCSGLRSVVLHEGLKAIGMKAFAGCNSIWRLALPQSVSTIAESAFEGCSSLTRLALPPNIISIGARAFAGCGELVLVVRPDTPAAAYVSEQGGRANVIHTDADAFEYSSENGGTITKYIGMGGDVVIPSEISGQPIANIGEFAFSRALDIHSLTVPGSIHTIGRYAFSECGSLEQVIIEEGVQVIDECAFTLCDRLEVIYLPNTIKRLNMSAFDGCNSLREMYIQSNVEVIRSNVFRDCPELTLYIRNNAYAIQYAEENGIPYVLSDEHHSSINTLSADMLKSDAVMSAQEMADRPPSTTWNTGAYPQDNAVELDASVPSTDPANAVPTPIAIDASESSTWNANSFSRGNTVSDGLRIIEIAIGSRCYAAVDESNRLYVWGDPHDIRVQSVPDGLPPIVDIGIGDHCMVALDVYGKLHGWGEATGGETDFQEDLPPFVSVEVNGYQTVALTADGSVYAWGEHNQGGQKSVPDMPPIKKISMSGYIISAIDFEGKVYEWGILDAPLNAPGGIVDIASDYFTTVVLCEDGWVYGIAPNRDEAYNGQTETHGLTKVYAGDGLFAAINNIGDLHLWGEYRALEGDYPRVNTPINLPPIEKTVMSYYGVLCLGEDGKLYGWEASDQWAYLLDTMPEEINGFAQESAVFEPFVFDQAK